jgi:hypothetical protein
MCSMTQYTRFQEQEELKLRENYAVWADMFCGPKLVHWSKNAESERFGVSIFIMY